MRFLLRMPAYSGPFDQLQSFGCPCRNCAGTSLPTLNVVILKQWSSHRCAHTCAVPATGRVIETLRQLRHHPQQQRKEGDLAPDAHQARSRYYDRCPRARSLAFENIASMRLPRVTANGADHPNYGGQ